MADLLKSLYEDAGAAVAAPASSSVSSGGTVADLGEPPLYGAGEKPDKIKNRKVSEDGDEDQLDSVAVETDAADEDDTPDVSMRRALKFKAFKRRTSRHSEEGCDSGEKAPQMRIARPFGERFLSEMYAGTVSASQGPLGFTISYDPSRGGFSMVSDGHLYENYGLEKSSLSGILSSLGAVSDLRGGYSSTQVALHEFPGFRTRVWVSEQEELEKVDWAQFSPTTVLGNITAMRGDYLLSVNVVMGQGKREFIFNGNRTRMLAILTILGASSREDSGGPDKILEKVDSGVEVEAVLNFDRLVTVGKAYASQINWK